MEQHTTTDGVAEAPPAPRLLSLRAAARYVGISHWTLRDLVAAGALPVVALPSGRINSGRTRGGKRAVRIVAPVTDDRMRPLRRYLIDRVDLDAFVDRHKRDTDA